MKLPDYVKNTVWDVVFVDGPRGYNDKVPGRMQSIYLCFTTEKLVIYWCTTVIVRLKKPISNTILVNQIPLLINYFTEK